MKPLVIFLNGTSSSGKTSLALALQELYREPLLHTGIDTLYDMLPAYALGSSPSASKGYRYIMRNGLLDHIEIGPYAQRLLECTVPLTQVLLAHGNELVIDEILFSGEGRSFLTQYADAFVQARAYFIKIECPLAVLEAREAARPDRHRGIARAQFATIHAHGYAYDYSVSTDLFSPTECAQQILAYVASHEEPTAFARIRRRLKECL